ncbi:MAG: TPM domain-containing protein [Acidobacteriales bacterium]|nr:TPM domain-containing protein [Terriglobales bacterium]
MKSGTKAVLRGPALIVALAALLLAAPALRADPIAQLHATDYVNDFAHVLDQTAIAKLDNICQQVDQKAHAQIAIVTVNSLDGSDIESYAADLFKKWGVGGKSSNRGVLILLVPQEHKYRIEVGYGLEPILPDGKVGGFGREAVPQLKQGDYSGAVSLMTLRVANVIAQDAGVSLTDAEPPPEPIAAPAPGMPVGMVIFLAVIFMILLFTRFGRMMLFGMLLGGRGGFGGGGWSGSGGFGGGGGGGGFGGFGGGSSGGGGASGSW